MQVSAGVLCEVGWIAAVGIHHIKLIIPIAIGRKGDALTVRRPRRIPVVASVVREVGCDIAAEN